SVLQAQGSVLTNKYAEGLPGRRYYGGCEYVDVVENIARDRAKALFGAEFANVQPHSGAQANEAVLHALMTPGERLLGLDFAAFRSIADEVDANLWVDMAHFAGLVAVGLHPSPVPDADVVSTTVHKTLGGGRSGMILGKQEYAKAINSAVFPGQQGGP